MNNLKILFYDYLKGVGQLPDISMGDGTNPPLNITKAQNDFFIQQIYHQGKTSDRLIAFLITGLVFILLFGLSLVFYFQKPPLFIATVFIVTVASVFLITLQLKKIWLEKNLITITIGLMSDLPPKEAAGYILRIYLQLLQRGSEQSNKDFLDEVLRKPNIKQRKEFSDKTIYIRRLVNKNKIELALDKLQEIENSHQFTYKTKDTLISLLNEFPVTKNNKHASITFKGKILDICTEIDNEIEEYYQ